ncbi:MAG TPA: fused MFS/spermidine synthase, partial [Herpetosiphonaceae bacterium]
ASGPIALLIPLHLVGFFVFTMMTHGQLAADRPEPRHLTEFYLLMSLGGVIGGAFNALLAPLIFDSVLEYPLTLILTCLLAPQLAQAPAKLAGRRWDALLPLAAGGLAAGGFFAARALGYGGTPIELALMYAIPMLLCFSMSRRPVRFALGVSAVLAASALSANAQGAVLYTDRSFFGINKVVLRAADNRRMLIHGNTLHGLQNLPPANQRQPLAYYYPTGPIGQVFTAARAIPELRRVAVVGLGSGALACYAAPGQSWTFYEIDPVVAEIARDPRYFSYLSDCAPDARIELGDARLSLRDAASQSYDILVLDAYSSDAIPVHLVTREALRLYLDKLAPGGILAFHISNRHLDLEPVLGNLAQDAGLTALTLNDTAISPEEERDGKWPAQWVVMSREAALDQLGLKGDWQPIRRAPATPVWTDDYSSIVQTLRFLSGESDE